MENFDGSRLIGEARVEAIRSVRLGKYGEVLRERAIGQLQGKTRTTDQSAGRSFGVTARRSSELGSVYTPPLLAKWVAQLLLRLTGPNPRTIWDLACGEGALLDAIAQQSPGTQLVGCDIDGAALRRAQSRLDS